MRTSDWHIGIDILLFSVLVPDANPLKDMRKKWHYIFLFGRIGNRPWISITSWLALHSKQV